MTDDYETLEEIERRNVGIARRIVEYWRRQAVEISLTGDPTKELRSTLGPGGLPRGYRGEDAIGLKRTKNFMGRRHWGATGCWNGGLNGS